jgi:hypothetical protein
MWMSNQYHAVPQYLAHCPFSRQHNPCNFIEMYFLAEIYMSEKSMFRVTWTIFHGLEYRNVQPDRAELAHIIHGSASRNRAKRVPREAYLVIHARFVRHARKKWAGQEVSSS